MPEAHADENSVIRLCVFDRIIAGYERELQQLRRQDRRSEATEMSVRSVAGQRSIFRIRKAA